MSAQLRTTLVTGPGLVTASGEIDLRSAPELSSAISSCAAHRAQITVDLSEVTFMDGAGLAVLLHARSRMRRRGGTLRLRAPHERVRRILQLTAMEHAFVIV